VSRVRIVAALAGFLLALLGVALDDKRLAWAAIGVLALSLTLRLILRKRANHPSDND
jgi:uncharacterized membrane protein YfcA